MCSKSYEEYISGTFEVSRSTIIHTVYSTFLELNTNSKRIEILEPYRFSLKSQIQMFQGDSLDIIKKQRSIIKQRIIIGINACTRELESRVKAMNESVSCSADLLVLGTDIQPASMIAHTPTLAIQMSQRVPIFALPGTSPSEELGTILGTKNVSCLLFLSRPLEERKFEDEEEKVHKALDSFIEYFLAKLKSIESHPEK